MGLLQKIGRDGQVDGGGVDADMAEERAQVEQAFRRFDSLPVPAQERSNSEGVAQVVSPWRTTSPCAKAEARHQQLKCRADAVGADRVPSIEGEQWCLGAGRVPPAVSKREVVFQGLVELRSERDEPALEELALANLQ